jgi:ATP-dependent RNA helicase DeaD
MKFTELELEGEILRALKEIGYEDMTPIQELTMPHIMAGRDLLGLAETGSGKTGACAVPLIQRIDANTNAIQALILVPTRELALQYVMEIDSIATHTKVVPFAVFGGFDMGIQRAKLRHGVHILVATPGRLIDFLWNTDLVDLTKVLTVVLDEADEMLKMGFVEDIDFIMSCLIHEHETLLFSATMPTTIDRLAATYLNDPVRVELNKDQRAPQSLIHSFEHVGRGRFESLLEYLNSEEIVQAIVFCNSRDNGTDLMNSLKKKFTSVEYIHGGLDQDRRISIFNRFRSKKIKFMVATDVAGRGLDFSHVSHVINYDFPPSSEIYTHRTGRTGRMGREGTAMTFVANRNLDDLKSMLKANRIDPAWRGDEPSLNGARKAASGEQKRPPRRRRPRRPEQKNAPNSGRKRER